LTEIGSLTTLRAREF